MVNAEVFNIPITIDPQRALRGFDPVDRRLEVLERQAEQLKTELNQALTVNTSRTVEGLDRIAESLERSEMQAIVTDARIGQIGRDLQGTTVVDDLNEDLEEAQANTVRLGGLLGTLASAAGVAILTREFIEASDSVAGLQNRLRLVTDTSEELAFVQNELFRISRDTRTEVDAVGTLYTRLALQQDELGRSSEELLGFTESLNQAIILSGATADEARAGLIQLSQGLAAGALRGDEFRSVSEQLPVILQTISRETGLTRGELIELSRDGKLSADLIIDSFASAAGTLRDDFGETVPTVGQQLTVLQNELTQTFAEVNESTGATTLLNNALALAADNLPVVALGLTAVGGTAVAAAGSLALATNAVRAFLVAAGPIGAIAVGVTSVGVAFQLFADEVNEAAEELSKLEEEARFLPELGSQISSTQRELNNLRRAVTSQAERGVEASESQLAAIERLEARIAAARGEIMKQAEDSRAAAEAQEQAAAGAQALEEAYKRQKELIESLQDPQEAFRAAQEDLFTIFDAGKLTIEEYSAALSALEERQARSTERQGEDPFEKQVESLERLNEELEIRANNAGVQEALLIAELGVTQSLADQNRELSDSERMRLNDALALRGQLLQAIEDEKESEREAQRLRNEAARAEEAEARRVERLKQEIDLQGQLNQKIAELNALRGLEGVEVENVDAAVQNLQRRQLEASNELSAGVGRALIDIQEEAKNLAAVGEDVVNVFANTATDALVEFARTGKFSFEEFARSILDQLLQIIARLLIVQALSAITGGADGGLLGGILAGATNRGAATGATVQPGQAPFPVNEEGQELFVPNRTGTIVPNPASVQQPAPAVNLTIVNEQDPRMVRRAIASGDNDDVLVNRVGENQSKFNGALSR